MLYKNRLWPALLLMLATLILLPACSAPPTNSQPPLVLKSAEPTPLPAAIRDIDPTPSQGYLQRADSYLQKLDAWSQKAAALLVEETAKSAP